jgi:hypothetical protein
MDLALDIKKQMRNEMIMMGKTMYDTITISIQAGDKIHSKKGFLLIGELSGKKYICHDLNYEGDGVLMMSEKRTEVNGEVTEEKVRDADE